MPGLCHFDQKCLMWVFLGYNFKRTMAIFEISNPRICLIAKYCDVTKMPRFGTKSALFGYFWARILKNCSEHPRISAIAKFREETKMPSSGIWVIFGKNLFKKTFEISTLKFVYFQNLTKK